MELRLRRADQLRSRGWQSFSFLRISPAGVTRRCITTSRPFHSGEIHASPGCASIIEITRKPLLVAFIGKGGRVASGRQGAVHSLALRGKRTEVRKCVFHVAESAQNRAAIAGDGLFITGFGCVQIRAVASTLENRDG